MPGACICCLFVYFVNYVYINLSLNGFIVNEWPSPLFLRCMAADDASA